MVEYSQGGRHLLAIIGHNGIGETPDVLAEHPRLSAISGIDRDPEPMRAPGAPLMFMLRDPDGNQVDAVEAPAP